MTVTVTLTNEESALLTSIEKLIVRTRAIENVPSKKEHFGWWFWDTDTPDGFKEGFFVIGVGNPVSGVPDANGHHWDALKLYKTTDKSHKSNKRHKWTENDDIVACYLFKYGIDSLKTDFQFISEKLDISEGSIKMRIQNFKALGCGRSEKGALDSYSKQSEAIFNCYRNASQVEHKIDVLKILKNS